MKLISGHSGFAFIFALLMMACAASGSAGVIFDTGLGNFTTLRSPDDGPGQGISVGANTSITQIGFYMDAPRGGNIKFMIWDGTNSNLLFNQTDAIDPIVSMSLLLSKPFSFDLTAGNTYYFGVISNREEDVSFFLPQLSLTQNNLSVVPNNVNYTNFSTPSFSGPGRATIALQLVGGTRGAVPEPGTVGLISLGTLEVLVLARKRKVCAAPEV